MTLAIARLETECRVAGPGRAIAARALADAVDRVAREELPGALAETLGPGLERQPEVIRIRHLDVELRVGAHGLDLAGLARAWAQAVARALFTALAAPDGDGRSAVRRFASRDDYLVAALEFTLGQGDARWAFADLAADGGLAPGRVLALLANEEPTRLARALGRLDVGGRLAALLSACDELLLERVITTCSSYQGEGEFRSATIVVIASALLAHGLERRWSLVDHRQALRLWARLAMDGHTSHPPRHVLWALLGIRWLSRFDTGGSDDAPLALAARRALDGLPLPVRRVVLGEGVADASPAAARDRLRGLVTTLGSVLPASERPRPATALTLSSDWMGLLLLSDSVRRLDWWGRLVTTGALGGSRSESAFRFWLAAVAATIRRQSDTIPDDLDVADTLLGGIVAEASRADLRAFFGATDPRALRPIGVDERSWPAALARGTEALLLEFRSRVRGARQATSEFVIRQLLHLPGRAVVEERSVTVAIEASTWSQALHVSGVDDAVSAPWLEPRRLVFLLEGL